MRLKGHIVVWMLLLFGSIQTAIAQNRNSLTITEDRLVLQIDLQSPQKQLDSILKVAGIAGASAAKISKGDFGSIKDDGWNVGTREGDIVKFDRLLTDLNANPQDEPWKITTRIPSLDGKPGYPAPVNYGVNKYAKITVYTMSSGLTRFILPGYQRSKRVFLSGSFNNWSTLKGLMKKAGEGWMLDVMLAPGAYEYKYIVDGRWTTDPNNLVETDDGGGNRNSVFYKYNYTFKLAGYPSAHRITVAGDFNKWDANELIMEKHGNSWQREMYLNDGRHLYRFNAEGTWFNDPANPLSEKDADGNINSILNLGETVNFKLAGFTDAKKVMVSINSDNGDTIAYGMHKKAGYWSLPVTLAAGNYSYKFLVDGAWVADPENPNQSVYNGKSYSFLAVKPNHTFSLKGYDKAKLITLRGTFNKWETHGFTMKHIGDVWAINFYLKPGKYLYKFVIDGRWILDPGNKFWEQNEFNTGNSVLWVE